MSVMVVCKYHNSRHEKAAKRLSRIVSVSYTTAMVTLVRDSRYFDLH
jgi:hypothetical protein